MQIFRHLRYIRPPWLVKKHYKILPIDKVNIRVFCSQNSPDSKSDLNDDNINYRRVVPLVISSLLTGTAIGILLPVMPLFARDIGLSAGEYGLVMSVMGGSRLLTNIPAAYFADKYGRRPLLLIGPAITSLGFGLTGFCSSAYQLICVRLLSGAGGSLSMTASNLYLVDISTVRNRARTLAPGQTAFIVGMGLGPGVGGWLVDQVGATPYFFTIVAAVMSSSVLTNYLLLPETKVFHKNKIGSDGTTKTAATTRSTSGSSSTPSTSSNESVDDPKPPEETLIQGLTAQVSQWKEVVRDPNLKLMIVAHTAYWTCYSAVNFTMVPMLATGDLGMSGKVLGSCFTAIAIIQGLGNYPAAYISDTFGRKSALVPSAMIVGSAAVIFPHMETVEHFVAVMMFSAIGGTLWSSSSQSYISDMSSDKLRSQALAVHRSGGDLGIMLGAGLVGVLADFTSVSVSMGSMGASLIAAISVFGLRATAKNVSSEK